MNLAELLKMQVCRIQVLLQDTMIPPIVDAQQT